MKNTNTSIELTDQELALIEGGLPKPASYSGTDADWNALTFGQQVTIWGQVCQDWGVAAAGAPGATKVTFTAGVPTVSTDGSVVTGVAAVALGLIVKADGLILQGIERFQSGVNWAYNYVSDAWSNAVSWIGSSLTSGWNWLVRTLGLGS